MDGPIPLVDEAVPPDLPTLQTSRQGDILHGAMYPEYCE